MSTGTASYGESAPSTRSKTRSVSVELIDFDSSTPLSLHSSASQFFCPVPLLFSVPFFVNVPPSVLPIPISYFIPIAFLFSLGFSFLLQNVLSRNGSGVFLTDK
jgi:hypothetical protein